MQALVDRKLDAVQKDALNCLRPIGNKELSTSSTTAKRVANFVAARRSTEIAVAEPRERDGSPGRARTCDILINSQALYRLSYRGMPFIVDHLAHAFKLAPLRFSA
jgi:hypothetical protein